MNIFNKNAVFFIVSALLVPKLSNAATAADAASSDQGSSFNITLWCLVGLVIIFLFIIGMLASTLRQLAYVAREKNRKEKQSKAGAVVATLMLLLWSANSFAQSAAAAPSPQFISGIPIFDFYLIIGLLAFELIIIFSLTYFIHKLLKVIRDAPEAVAFKPEVAKKSWFWDNFNSAVSIEKEKDVLLDHDYDGIRELDNSLPPWWIYGFYLTIIVGVIYLYRYHVSHDGMSQQEEYVADMTLGEEQKLAYLAKSANNVDENTITLLAEAIDIAKGKETYLKNCVACHLADGGGSVGPNLTDGYWLHGGSIQSIFKSIKYGWQEKGMKSWKDDLSPRQMQEVASFIVSIKGTTPAVPKAPQGELFIEAQPTASSDSASAKK